MHRLLEPAFRLEHEVHLVCREDRSIEGFLAELAVHSLDLVLADAPAGPGLPVKLFSHHLGECGTTFFAAAPLAARLRPRFPRSLEGAPFVLPGAGSMLRRGLQQWFEAQDLRPRIVGDVDDSALLTVFGEMGVGAFATPAVVEREVRRR